MKKKEYEMQTVTINIEDKVLDKVMYVLKNLSDIEIVKSVHNYKKKNHTTTLKEFEKIINTKSENSITLDKSIILNPHRELSNDIS